jgi:hypothetical protein
MTFRSPFFASIRFQALLIGPWWYVPFRQVFDPLVRSSSRRQCSVTGLLVGRLHLHGRVLQWQFDLYFQIVLQEFCSASKRLGSQVQRQQFQFFRDHLKIMDFQQFYFEFLAHRQVRPCFGWSNRSFFLPRLRCRHPCGVGLCPCKSRHYWSTSRLSRKTWRPH